MDRVVPALLLLFVATPTLAKVDRRLAARMYRDLQSGALKKLSLYRGASTGTAFTTARRLQCPADPEALSRAVGSRLMSRSPVVTGLTSSPYTAGCFALGVRDGEPRSVQVFGAGHGFVGVTEGRLLPADRFTTLLERYRNALPTLLALMGKKRIVVDAEQLTRSLAERYPGILTAGFQRMIGASLDREAEYLVFGQQPRFDRVVEIARDDVVAPGASLGFNPVLLDRLARH
jgi:hypothetical protein